MSIRYMRSIEAIVRGVTRRVEDHEPTGEKTRAMCSTKNPALSKTLLRPQLGTGTSDTRNERIPRVLLVHAVKLGPSCVASMDEYGDLWSNLGDVAGMRPRRLMIAGEHIPTDNRALHASPFNPCSSRVGLVHKCHSHCSASSKSAM